MSFINIKVDIEGHIEQRIINVKSIVLCGTDHDKFYIWYGSPSALYREEVVPEYVDALKKVLIGE